MKYRICYCPDCGKVSEYGLGVKNKCSCGGQRTLFEADQAQGHGQGYQDPEEDKPYYSNH